jgi:glutamine amidotransferase
MKTSQRIVIIDYGIGNVHSIFNAISHLGYKNVLITSDLKLISKADVFILPGVGAFDEAMKNLKSRNLQEILNEQVIGLKKPILGICLGMQLFASFSDENGKHEGLNWIKGNVIKIEPSLNFSVPHVGWNNIFINQETPLFNNINLTHFYFDHSFHFSCDKTFISAYCEYGVKLTASIQYNNIFGVQFHPEKSQNNGLKLFRSFFNSVK